MSARSFQKSQSRRRLNYSRLEPRHLLASIGTQVFDASTNTLFISGTDNDDAFRVELRPFADEIRSGPLGITSRIIDRTSDEVFSNINDLDRIVILAGAGTDTIQLMGTWSDLALSLIHI